MTKISHDSETPAHGQQVITACAFIPHDFNGVTKVFMPKRAATKKFLPDIYELPGGHVDFGEDIVEALEREVNEELGMTVNVGYPYYVFTYENKVKGSHTVEIVYFAKFVEPIERISIQPEDHSRFDWFSKEEVIQHKTEMIPDGQATHKDHDEDAEFKAVIRGFDILDGKLVYTK